jgi:hypothetical protein
VRSGNAAAIRHRRVSAQAARSSSHRSGAEARQSSRMKLLSRESRPASRSSSGRPSPGVGTCEGSRARLGVGSERLDTLRIRGACDRLEGLRFSSEESAVRPSDDSDLDPERELHHRADHRVCCARTLKIFRSCQQLRGGVSRNRVALLEIGQRRTLTTNREHRTCHGDHGRHWSTGL